MMAEQRAPTPSGPRGPVRRHLRTTSQSPSRPARLPDDLITTFRPPTAYEALQNPADVLKTCLDEATPSEQAFATRTALASKKIYEWHEDLKQWPWPTGGGSAGFQVPTAKRRKVSGTQPPTASDDTNRNTGMTSQSEVEYYGSLSASHLIRYEARADEIHQQLDALDVEEIKTQVMLNHIMPLSRPGTPFSDNGGSVTSAYFYNKLNDLSAVVTAIIIFALPYLSRLVRLLNTWNIRFTVLRKVPFFLTKMADAQVALKSGWQAIESTRRKSLGDKTEVSKAKPAERLLRSDFDVMKTVLGKKVARPASDLDSMLDALETLEDTLPNEWLDHMEAIEKEYAEWVVAAEGQVRRAELSDILDAQVNPASNEAETPGPQIEVREPSPTKEYTDSFDDSALPSSPPEFSNQSESSDNESCENMNTITQRSLAKAAGREPVKKAFGADLDPGTDSGVVFDSPGPEYDGARESKAAIKKERVSKLREAFEPIKPALRRPIRPVDDTSSSEEDSPKSSPDLDDGGCNILRLSPPEGADPNLRRKVSFEDVPESSILDTVDEETEEEDDNEPSLPPMRRVIHSKSSDASLASTVLHSTSQFFDRSDSMSFREASMDPPELPRLPDPDEPFSSDAPSPPSSPPVRYNPAVDTSFSEFGDSSRLNDDKEKSVTPPQSPLGPPIVFDPNSSFGSESQFDISPSRMSITSGTSDDDHLRQQIGEILTSVPGKFKLATRTPSINLNPPDLQLPGRPKRALDPRRSQSALSSRATTPGMSRSSTPSFMLAPAREPRPRSQSSGAIKVYHLSKSTGEPPIKLFVRCVGEQNERVMVRVGGGWADLGEYLRDYAAHHSRKSRGEGKVEVRDVPGPVAAAARGIGSSPASRPTSRQSRPASALDSPMSPLYIRKTRRSMGEEGATRFRPKTPITGSQQTERPTSRAGSTRSRASSFTNWDEEDSALGMAGPKGKKKELSEENKAWVENVKEKVRIASGERAMNNAANNTNGRTSRSNGRTSRGGTPGPDPRIDNGQFGEMTKVGGTTRLYRKN